MWWSPTWKSLWNETGDWEERLSGVGTSQKWKIYFNFVCLFVTFDMVHYLLNHSDIGLKGGIIIIITSLFTHLIYNKVVKLIFLTSLINTQIIDDEFYIINIKNITFSPSLPYFDYYGDGEDCHCGLYISMYSDVCFIIVHVLIYMLLMLLTNMTSHLTSPQFWSQSFADSMF